MKGRIVTYCQKRQPDALTVKELEFLPEGSKRTDGGFDPDGEIAGRLRGSLIARRRKGRVQIEFYLRTQAGGTDQLHRIGTWSKTGDGGITLSQARAAALDLAKRYTEEGVGLKSALVADREAENAIIEQQRREDEQRESEQRGDNSLGALCAAYVRHLEARSRRSWRDVRNMFAKHVAKARPDLWGRPARLISKDDVHGILGGMLDQGIGRQTNMMRASLRAAFEFGLSMADDPRHARAAKVFRIEANPVARVKRMKQLDKAGDRVLTERELAGYMRHVSALPSPVMRAFLTLQLRLGGQRLEQLARCKWTDLRGDVLTQRDGKGRRDEPIEHVLPLVAPLGELIDTLRGMSEIWIFSPRGKTHMHGCTASTAVRDIAAEMLAAGEIREPFSAHDLRRTVATMFGELGISKDAAIEIQSHGRNSLVHRHYDRSAYLSIKRTALQRWNRLLDRLQAGAADPKVIPLRK
ncbi:MAG: tyrosine-type recombinase/integrase [Rhodocyclaceae bacterium]|nr:tyrosine-type recombinase/integrase [Rhodocyclaceae bacterium]